MLVGLFVLAVLVIGAIVLAVYLVTGDDHVEEDPREAIDLGDILNGTFSVRRFNGTWIDDSSYQFWDSSVSQSGKLSNRVLNLVYRNVTFYIFRAIYSPTMSKRKRLKLQYL